MGSLKQMALVFGLSAVLVPLAFAEEWKEAKNEEGIKIELSAIPGSDYKAYRGVTFIKAPLAKVRALQEDIVGACSWIHECKSQKLLKTEGDQSWTYTQFNTPWPVTARDSVMHVTTNVAADGSLTRKLEGVPKYLPEEKGFVRVAKVDGFWKLQPKDGGTEVTYQVHTEPGGSVPSMVANKFVVDAPFNTLKALKARAEKP
ncbi:START domain-containing protein [Pseudomonas rubra]|uniref:START domain-containing protein n=1 Tax=Pseudomonas rubra TaxID=2942627 RepID=A0ABT5P5F4_9PSED|nr:START domain-containing protein [Pseudomonas rubra]MDD1013367.1 START domain-containing protein [Pseudomonas rubra]MDD1040514.1 START domain-containing protein [Pseudomonas rubra]MDD1155119.1 START domain-containing protein [Pseudomonas rubra]